MSIALDLWVDEKQVNSYVHSLEDWALVDLQDKCITLLDLCQGFLKI